MRGRTKSPAEGTLEVKIRGLALDAKQTPVVLLEDGRKRVLPIWIGVFEATAIQVALEEVAMERPLTHDLLAALVEAMGGVCEQVCIADLRDNTYIAEIHVRMGEDVRLVDSRPSDALALAVRYGCPIRVATKVFETAHVELADSDQNEEDAIRRKLEELGPDDLGKYTM